jgi:hypothetical protein
MTIRPGNPASSEPARCIVCKQPYEPHPNALDRVIAAWTGNRLTDGGFCPHCRALIDMTPDEHTSYMSTSDAEIRAAINRTLAQGLPLPKGAREWLARQNRATDQAERLPDA